MKDFTRLVIFACFFGSVAVSAASQQKTRIYTPEELPLRTYQLKGKALEILEDKAQLDRLSVEVAANVSADLEKYDIPVKPILRGYYSVLLLLHMYRGEHEQALAFIARLNELDNFALAKLNTLFAESWIQAVRQSGGESSPEFRTIFERNYAEGYSRLPYSEIALGVEESKSELTLPRTLRSSSAASRISCSRSWTRRTGSSMKASSSRFSLPSSSWSTVCP